MSCAGSGTMLYHHHHVHDKPFSPSCAKIATDRLAGWLAITAGSLRGPRRPVSPGEERRPPLSSTQNCAAPRALTDKAAARSSAIVGAYTFEPTALTDRSKYCKADEATWTLETLQALFLKIISMHRRTKLKAVAEELKRKQHSMYSKRKTATSRKSLHCSRS